MKVGDKVKFLNDVGGGKITKVIDKKTVLVLNDDDFEVPVLIYDLLEVEEADFFHASNKGTNLTNNTENKTTVITKIKEVDFFGEEDDDGSEKDTDEIDLYFAIVPTNKENPTFGELDLYLINDSNWNLMYNYQTKFDKKYKSFPGKISPNMKEHLITLDKKDLHSYKNIIFQALVYQKDSIEFRNPINKNINLKPELFYKTKTFKANDFFEEKAYLLPIYEENLMAEAMKKLTKSEVTKVIKEKARSKTSNKPKQFKIQDNNQTVEIDLHIHELIDNEKGMSRKDKLDLQMKKFEEELKKAVSNTKVKKIVFIHGKGEGVLKNEIHNRLKRIYKELSFQDASFKEYGFGATMVFV